MKTMVVYDSVFGNTEKIAQAVGHALGNAEDVAIVRVGDVKPEQFAGIKLLVVGSPTQRFSPMPAIASLLKGIPRNSLKGVKVAAFDTRLTMAEINETPILAFFVRLFGRAAYAAKAITNQLKKKGLGILITDHSVRETLSITDRAYIIYSGRILLSGTAKKLATDKKAKSLYLGKKFRL